MGIIKKRKEYFWEYKIKGNKDALTSLVYSFYPHIESIIKKYDYDQEELRSIAIEAVINCINDYSIDNDIDVLVTYIHKYIRKYIKKYIMTNVLSYDQYVSSHKNGEEGSFTNMEYVLLKPIVANMLKYLNENYPQYAEVIKLRYGLDGNPPMTLEEISEIQEISFQGVKKREEKALMLLKGKFEKYM